MLRQTLALSKPLFSYSNLPRGDLIGRVASRNAINSLRPSASSPAGNKARAASHTNEPMELEISRSRSNTQISMPRFGRKEAAKILEQCQQEYTPNQMKQIVTSMKGETPQYHPSIHYPSREQLHSVSNISSHEKMHNSEFWTWLSMK